MAKDDFVFFWSGPFSQWAESPFIIDGTRYNCAEQYMMAAKAKMFGDAEALRLIMESDDPRFQKATGRKVKGFDQERWEMIARSIVFDGNYAKFIQNPWLYKELLATGEKTIVEASPFDKIWGIGLAEDDPRAWDKSTWLGKNWLGYILMDVRISLRADI